MHKPAASVSPRMSDRSERTVSVPKIVPPSAKNVAGFAAGFEALTDVVLGDQCRAVASALTEWAKQKGVAVILVSHVNKSGDLAGPKAAEHLVDGTLEFDPASELGDDGEPTEKTKNWRKLTSGSKFRLGPSGESELFEMTNEGVKPIKKKSKLIKLKDDDDDNEPEPTKPKRKLFTVV